MARNFAVDGEVGTAGSSYHSSVFSKTNWNI